MRDLSVAIPVAAPSGFALAFLNTYVSDLAAGKADGGTMPLRYTVTHIGGLVLERDVNVHVEYVPQPGGAPASLTIAWEPDERLFPSFKGVLHAMPEGERACTLSIAGTYDVPGGIAGQIFDAVVGVRIAHGTIEQLLEQFRDAIQNDYKLRTDYN